MRVVLHLGTYLGVNASWSHLAISKKRIASPPSKTAILTCNLILLYVFELLPLSFVFILQIYRKNVEHVKKFSKIMRKKNGDPQKRDAAFEQEKRVGLLSSAWEADALPLCYSCLLFSNLSNPWSYSQW